jgi:hypothetical protein
MLVPAAVPDDDGMPRLDKLPHGYRAEVEGAVDERYAHDETIVSRRTRMSELSRAQWSISRPARQRLFRRPFGSTTVLRR